LTYEVHWRCGVNSNNWPVTRNIKTMIILFGMVMLCSIWAGLYYKVQSEREIEMGNAVKDTDNYSRLFEENTVRTIKSLDQMVLFLKYRVEHEGMSIDIPKFIHEKMFEGQPYMQLEVINENGDLVASNIVPFVKTSLVDREHFLVHKDADSGKLFISKSFQDRESGKWSIQLTRRINKADGSFGGVAAVSMDPFYFTEFLNQIDLGENYSMAVIGRDGFVRVRKVGQEGQVGLDFRQRLQNEMSGNDAGNYIATSVVDNIKRFSSYRSLPEYPLIVTLGVTETQAFLALNSRIASYYWVCGSMSLLIALFVTILLAGIARGRQVEEELAKERNLLLTLINLLPDRVHIKDRESRFIINNIAHLKALGASSQAEVLGKTDYDFRPASVSDRHFSDDQSVMATDQPRYNYEEPTIHPSGKLITLLASKVPFHNSNSEVIGVVGISRDITEQKKNEIRQQRQRKMLELLAQGASLQKILRVLIDGVEDDIFGSIASVWLLDERKQRLYHTASVKLPTFFIQARDGNELEPDSGPCSRAVLLKNKVIDEDLQASPYRENFRKLAKEAGIGACWSEPILSEEGEVLGTLAVYFANPTAPSAEDMELVLDASHWAGIAIKSLRQQEKLVKLSLAVEQSPATVVITDPVGNITYVNRRFTEVSGYGYDEVIGQNPRILKTEETPQELYTDLWRTIKSGGIWHGEFVNKKKNGEYYWEKTLINPILNEQGLITHFLAIKEDITEFKRNQQALERAKEAAESANRMKSAFVANISHEIRTPMNAIMGFTEILLRDASLTDQQRQHLEIVSHSGEHLLELINDVLEMSKIEAGRSTPNPTEFDARLVLHDLASMFHVKADEKTLQLLIETQPTLPASIVTDKSKFRQILVNLLGNAVKFTKEGKVTVRMWAQPVDERPGCLLVFVDVEDTGPGINVEDIKKLFQVFSQTEIGAAAGGAGLGLTISRSYARLLGGDITVTSQEGKGSCFHVEILAGQGSDDWMESLGNRDVIGLASDQKTWRILIVDDEEINRQLLIDLMENNGFETRQAVDGENAVAVFTEWGPDLVLMDVHMPKMDGYEATRRIKILSQGKCVPVIGISAGVFEEDRKNALTSGMDAFVTKPFKSQDILHIIEEYLPVRYLYQESTSSPPRVVLDPSVLESELGKVPHEIIEQIRICAGSADYYELIEQIEKLQAFSPTIASFLRDLSLHYDYEKCIEAVGRERESKSMEIASAHMQPEILMVDDMPENLQLLAGMFNTKGYKVRPVPGGRLALEIARRKPPDLILLDITMPDMNGYEVCAALKANPVLKDIPVIFISALSDMDDKVKAFDAGGVDYITKPFKAAEVQARVNIHLQLLFLQRELKQRNINLDMLVQEQVKEIAESQQATIFALAKLAESRDDETGKHLERVQQNCVLLANWLKENSPYKEMISAQFVENIMYASPLHDIGKVGVPDAILLKQGKLTAAEFEVAKKHSVIGAATLAAVQHLYPKNSFINMGAEIARAHHEKWDGSGYPDGLAGEQISLAARIMAVADVYDALRTKRVYKPAFSQEKTCRILFEGSGSHFDPVVIEAFRQLQDQFDKLQTDSLGAPVD